MVSTHHKKTAILIIIFIILTNLLIFRFFNVNKNPVIISNPNQKIATSNGNDDLSINIDANILPKINYSQINDSWKTNKIDMLIVSPNRQDFVNALKPLMEWNNQKGVKTVILSNFSSYEGNDKAEKIRNMIKSYYEKHDIQWVLLAGDAENNLIPIRYVYNPDTVIVGQGESEYGDWSDYYKPTDFYYADLNGTWDDNHNGIYGESSVYTGGSDEIDWTPEVYVGRFPASNANELEIMVNKTLQYEMNPYVGDWMNQMLLAGGVSSLNPLEDEAKLTNYIWNEYLLSEMNFTNLYRTASPYDPPTPPAPNEQGGLTSNSFESQLNLGYSTVFIAGHGQPTKFNDYYGTIFLSSDSVSNYNMPSLIYSDACSTASYDKTDNNLGETLINSTDSGAIGFIGALRLTWYFENDPSFEMLNRANAKLFWEEFFLNEEYQPGKALYDSKVAYMNSSYFTGGSASMDEEWERKNVLTYCLLGDPEIDIYTNIPVSVKNAFKGTFYECEHVSLTIKNAYDEAVANARVHIYTSNGKYSQTIYSDSNGNIEFNLPEGRRLYNVTITGHDLLASNFNFRTTSDSIAPTCENLTITPKNPTVSENLTLGVLAKDPQTGIESLHLLLSNDNFATYSMQELQYTPLTSKNYYTCNISKLKPGEYSVLILARDYANNTELFYNQSIMIQIPTPIIDYVLNFALFSLFGIMGVVFYFTYFQIKSFKKKEEIFKVLT